jgi:Fe-S-cluster containining protein
LRAAGLLELSPAEFRRRFRLRLEDGVHALDPGSDSPCTFYDDETGCAIYEARPTQCRTWPFWPEVVNRKRSWERAARDCEGMDQGRCFSVTEIERGLMQCEEIELPEGDSW